MWIFDLVFLKYVWSNSNTYQKSQHQQRPPVGGHGPSLDRTDRGPAVQQKNSGVIIGRTGSLRKAFTTSDESDEEVVEAVDDERRPLQQPPQPQPRDHLRPQQQSQQKQTKLKINNSQSSTSDYHSDPNDNENPNLLPVEHRELPNTFRLHQLNRWIEWITIINRLVCVFQVRFSFYVLFYEVIEVPFFNFPLKIDWWPAVQTDITTGEQ